MSARPSLVRQYRPGDLPFYIRSLEGLQDHLISVDEFGIVQRGPRYGSTYARVALRTLRRNRGFLLIAESDGEPVGFVAAHLRPANPIRELELRPKVQGFIMDLFVVPEARGRGVGTALIRAAERRLARAGCTHVWLDVFVPNWRARALYEALGYRGFGLMMLTTVRPPSRKRVRAGPGAVLAPAGARWRPRLRPGRRSSRNGRAARHPRRHAGPRTA